MTRIGLLLLLFLGAPALAVPPPKPIPFNDAQGRNVDTIHVPPRSPVRFTKWLKGNVAQFEGRFVLTGTYYYGDSLQNNGSEFVGQAHIIPDRDLQVPQLVKRIGPRAIGIDNPDIFADAAIPAGVLQRVRRKGGGYATGHVAIRVEGFTIGIACDSPSYATDFASVYIPAGARVESSRPRTGC
jgi:hypothetical protein